MKGNDSAGGIGGIIKICGVTGYMKSQLCMYAARGIGFGAHQAQGKNQSHDKGRNFFEDWSW